MEIEKDELNVLESLQESIISKNKEKNESKNTTADDLFGKIFGEDLRALLPISKLQAKDEIQHVLFKYHMAAMQDSLQRKLNSLAMVDDNVSPSKTEKTQSSNNFGKNFQANFSPNFSINSLGGNHHHSVKSVQMRGYFWSVFSCIRTEYGDLLHKMCQYVSVKYQLNLTKIENGRRDCLQITFVTLNGFCLLSKPLLLINKYIFYSSFPVLLTYLSRHSTVPLLLLT